jgi:hypothetical protein
MAHGKITRTHVNEHAIEHDSLDVYRFARYNLSLTLLLINIVSPISYFILGNVFKQHCVRSFFLRHP